MVQIRLQIRELRPIHRTYRPGGYGGSVSGHRVQRHQWRDGYHLRSHRAGQQRQHVGTRKHGQRDQRQQLTGIANRLDSRGEVEARALFARSRPDVVDLVSRLERDRIVGQFYPRQLAPREQVNVGLDRGGIVERPGADEQRLTAGCDCVAAPYVGAAVGAEERLVILAGASTERD